MAISTRMSRNPVTPSAQLPSIGTRPSSSRPSSVKNSMAASMSSTTMPTLSMRVTVMMSPKRLTHRISGEHPLGDAFALVTREPLPIQVHAEVLVGRMAEARQCSTGLQFVGGGDTLVEHLDGGIVRPAGDYLAGPDRATGVDTEDASVILGDK